MDYRECDAWNSRSVEGLVFILLLIAISWALTAFCDFLSGKFEKRRVLQEYNNNLLRQRIRKEILHERNGSEETLI
jgi:hypothetical protein